MFVQQTSDMQRWITSLWQPLPWMPIVIHRLKEEGKLRALESENEGAVEQTSKSK
jgi:hypothetical protein